MDQIERPPELTKVCPRCAEEIKAAATACRFCGAEFVLTRRGYCANCHQVMALAAEAITCPRCAEPMIDIRVDTRLLERPLQAPGLSAAAPAPQAVARAAQVPTGEVRRAKLVGARQVLGLYLVSLAAVALAAMPFLGRGAQGLRIYERGGPYLVQYATLGPLFFVAGVVILIALPREVLPRRIGGSRLRARVGRRQFVDRVHREIGGRGLYRARGYGVRVGVVLLLWLASAAAYFAIFGDKLSEPGVTSRGGATTTWVIIAVGLLGSLLMVPTGAERTIGVDDEGTFHD